ncbi:guanine nucleotide binding protein, alpha subunit [Russula brevipes]|nr:guanine nucleotide binding protein, alpha subunit [Russula brevipes]
MNTFASWKQRRAEIREKRRAVMQRKQRAKAHSDEIDRQLEESRNFEKQNNILLISAPGSEVNAFNVVKELRYWRGGDTSEGLADFRPVIWNILLENLRSIVWVLRSKNADPATEANYEYILDHRNDIDNPGFRFLPDFARVVRELWIEEILPLLLDHPSDLLLDDNAEYFIAEVQRITTSVYSPSIEDIRRTSKRGVSKTDFNVDLGSVRVSHVYGQQGDHRKWLHLFEDAATVVFCASLADYDRPGITGGGETRLAESLELFEAVVKSCWFPQTSIILYLTGLHELKAKFCEVPLARYFPEYAGGTDANEGSQYIISQFLPVIRGRRRTCHLIIEDSTWSGMCRLIASVEAVILEKTFDEAGIL